MKENKMDVLIAFSGLILMTSLFLFPQNYYGNVILLLIYFWFVFIYYVFIKPRLVPKEGGKGEK